MLAKTNNSNKKITTELYFRCDSLCVILIISET